jgi:uncharacterized protein
VLPDWFGPLLLTVGGLEAGISPDAAAPVSTIADISPRPLLLIADGQDQVFVPYNAEALYMAAAEPKSLWEVAGAVHTGAYDNNPQVFVDKLDAFYSRSLGASGTTIKHS